MTHKTLRRVFFIPVLAVTLALGLLGVGCGSTPTITARNAVAGAATVFAGARLTYVAYASLPRCNVAPAPCSDAQKVVTVGNALLAAREAISLARDVVDVMAADVPLSELTAEQRAAVDNAAKAAAGASASVGEIK